jgi:RHS repeat-associated protein
MLQTAKQWNPVTVDFRKTVHARAFWGALALLANLIAMRTATAGDAAGNSPWPTCGPCQECVGGGPAGSSEGAYTTDKPVSLRDGAVRESVVDLKLDGPVFAWAQSRTYRHQATDNGLSRLGNHWFDGLADFRITDPGGIGNYWRPSYGDDSAASGEYELTISAHSLIPLVRVGSTNEFKVPADYHLTVVEDTTNKQFVVREKYSDKVYLFHSFDGTIDADLHGRLKEITTRQWLSSGDPGWEFTYNLSNGNLLQITTPPPHEYNISYAYNSLSTGRISSVEVWDGPVTTGVRVMRVEYTYFDDDLQDASADWHNDVGESGDLVQVKVMRRASNDSGNNLSEVRYTQYRYVAGSWGGITTNIGRPLGAVFEHADVMQMAADASVADPTDLLELGDGDVVSGFRTVAEYASRGFRYYTTDESTTNVPTGWGVANEDLEATYAPSSPYAEDHEFRVKEEYIGSASCASCSGDSASRLRRVYYYMNLKQGDIFYIWVLFHQFYGNEIKPPNDINEVTGVVVEDTFAEDDGLDEEEYPYGRPLYRTVYGLNDFGRKLREVKIENPHAETINCWCQAWTYVDCDLNDDGDFSDVGDKPLLKHRVAEYRTPWVYLLVNTNAELRKFLDPYDDPRQSGVDTTSAGWANDNDAMYVNGAVYVYEYDALGRRTGERVKRGEAGTAYYISATDWGDGTDDKPTERVVATYQFPTQTTSRTASDRITTEYQYEFWDDVSGGDTQIMWRKTKLPTIPTSQNGSNVQTVTEEYFDQAGRLRWTKDGEGYVNYYSYHPGTGQAAFEAVDVNPASAPSGSTGNDAKWVSWNDDGDGDSSYNSSAKPARGGGLPTAMALVSSHEFDALGREYLHTDPRGAKHYTAYETDGDVDRIIRFRYWNSSVNEPVLPIEVSEQDAMDRLSSVYTLGPDTPTLNGSNVPIALGSTLEAATRETLTRHIFDPYTGRHVELRRYHDTSGNTIFTHYYPTQYLYDAEGRLGATIQAVENAKYQVDVNRYDVRGLTIERRRGVVSSAPNDYYAIASSSLPSGYATLEMKEYNYDGYVLSHRIYHGPDEYSNLRPIFTFRGHVRAIRKGYQYNANSSLGDVMPHRVFDVDWMGRKTAEAYYLSTPSWFSVIAAVGNEGYSPYAATNSTDRFDLTTHAFDVQSRVYRKEHFPGTSANKLQTNNYYDRNGRLVCTGDKYSAHTEYAYDGAGRQYQERTVTDVSSAKYSSGAFQYRAPAPAPAVAGISTTGDDGLIAFTHITYDLAGNLWAKYEFEVNHDDTNGIDIDSISSYVRHTTNNYFDAADRIIASVNFGAVHDSGSQRIWKLSSTALPSRSGPVPNWTYGQVFSGEHRLTTYAYDPASGRQELVSIGVKQNGSDTVKMDTKTFYDDLGRRRFVVENWDGSYNPVSGSPSSSANSNRTTGWKYDGLNNVTELTAYNSNSTSQVTKYYYTETFDAKLPTHTVYPDSTSTPSSGTDLVKREYNVDGSLKKLTDQRGVIHEYTYNERRQLVFDKATTIPTSVYGGNSETDAVRAIQRTYDSRGRLENIYSYSDVAATTVLNRIRNFFYDGSIGAPYTGRFWFSSQYHDATQSYAVADLVHSSESGGIYTNGLRSRGTSYPNNDFQVNFEFGHDNPFANADNVHDRLNRITGLEVDSDGDNGGTAAANQVAYAYNGIDRLVSTDYVVPDVLRTMRALDGAGANDYNGWNHFGEPIKNAWYDYSSSNVLLDRFEYTYDHAGNRLSRDIPSGLYATNDRDETYAYDGLQRLAQTNLGTFASGFIADGSAKFRQKWTLDALGNWPEFKQDGLLSYATAANNSFADATDLDQDRVHNKVNEIDTNDVDDDSAGASITAAVGQANWIDPVYDKAGNMMVVPRPSLPTSLYIVFYDAWNRAIKIQTVSQTVQKNEYDGLHRRIVKEKYVSGTLNETRHYYYNENWQVVEERVGADAWTARVDARYVWNPQYVDSLALRYWDSNASGGPDTFHYFLQDANYNVTAVTDNTGAVVERYAYTSYGEPIILNGSLDADSYTTDFSVDGNQLSDVANVYLYTGRERDPETGLQLNRNRFYAAGLGRWLTRDPIGYEGSKWNLYEYVESSPTRHCDPLGLGLWDWWPWGNKPGPVPGPPAMSVQQRLCNAACNKKYPIKPVLGGAMENRLCKRTCDWVANRCKNNFCNVMENRCKALAAVPSRGRKDLEVGICWTLHAQLCKNKAGGSIR